MNILLVVEAMHQRVLPYLPPTSSNVWKIALLDVGFKRHSSSFFIMFLTVVLTEAILSGRDAFHSWF